jgi:uncharacterized protein YbbC (DUF1343 family)
MSGCTQVSKENDSIKPGAELTNEYLKLLKDKRVAVVANQTSVIGKTHLVDSLINSGIDVVKVLGPEHGFRGNAGAGEKIKDNRDVKTGLPVISLYGKHKKPTKDDLKDVDIVVFDIQDVGVRFYTYISTMTYVMEACAESNIGFLVLDRPNPHGSYIDGPVLEPDYSSFVGMHQVPVVHGMTVGEYAGMVNEEGWLANGVKCNLKVIKIKNYTHSSYYKLPIPPSPNLPNMNAIELYPSLCFFEGTIISVGRGTKFPFQVIGHPDYTGGDYTFTPVDIPGAAMNPKYEGEKCYGYDLSGFADSVLLKKRLDLRWLIQMYNFFKDKDDFFNSFFDKLAGTDKLRKQIVAGLTEDEIRESWKPGLKEFDKIRKKYLLYPNFE